MYTLMRLDNNTKAFFELLRAGLWEKEVRLASLGTLDFGRVYRLAQEQSVIGLVAAGLEHIVDIKLPREAVMPFMTSALSLEKRNLAMNSFIADLFPKMEDAGIKALLVKGQGVAQCYERPLWRACGDVDLLLDEENYQKAKMFLSTVAQRVEDEYVSRRHLAMTIAPWEVELHGTLRTNLWKRMDAVIDAVQGDTFENNRVRIWLNGSVDVLLPAADNDVVFVFTHILQHYFRGGIGLRQICDWCRLLWTYRLEIDFSLLELRLREMGVMTEWKAFAALAVEWLGMPHEVMPFYSSSAYWRGKAGRILSFVLETGNFGHNRDVSYFSKPYLVRKAISLWRHTLDGFRRLLIFPLDSMRAWRAMLVEGVEAVRKGK